MHFRTEISTSPSLQPIGYNDRLLLIGSCFSEHITGKLQEALFRVESNPFGILYNPRSIADCLQLLLSGQTSLGENQIIRHQGLWHSWLHHGKFSQSDRKLFDESISRSIQQGRQALQDASVLIITFGTAWIYTYQGKTVSNCHKMPANLFERKKMSVEEIVQLWQPLTDKLQSQGKRVIFTVSPIRHIKDGLHENQLSKSTLLLAIEQLKAAEYFPSYEIMMDDLRDYRFYADDMLHPSPVAVDYIWEHFCNTYFTSDTQQQMRPLQQLYKDFAHKPLHTDSDEWLRFTADRERRLKETSTQYPWIKQKFEDLKI